jgi:hypothetical protein
MSDSADETIPDHQLFLTRALVRVETLLRKRELNFPVHSSATVVITISIYGHFLNVPHSLDDSQHFVQFWF